MEPFNPFGSKDFRAGLTGLQVAALVRIGQFGGMQIPNPVSPDRMSADERLEELAAILAAGARRLKARQSSRRSGRFGESYLDCPGEPSRHVAASEAAEERT